jgi:hypothetical protein
LSRPLPQRDAEPVILPVLWNSEGGFTDLETLGRLRLSGIYTTGQASVEDQDVFVHMNGVMVGRNSLLKDSGDGRYRSF